MVEVLRAGRCSCCDEENSPGRAYVHVRASDSTRGVVVEMTKYAANSDIKQHTEAVKALAARHLCSL